MVKTTYALKRRQPWLALLLLSVWLGGCATPGAAPGPETRKAGSVAPGPETERETPSETVRSASPAATLIEEARELEAQGAVDEAGSVLERAVRLDPASGEAWLALAQLRAANGDTEGARNFALRALNVSADEPETARSARALLRKLERSARP